MLGINARERQKLLNVRLQMVKRCYDKHDPSFENYGGRGIKVCDRWRYSPNSFIEDVWPRPLGMTIERIDNNGDYCPSNVRWATRAEQVKNRRNNINILVDGVSMNLADACRLKDIDYRTVFKRLQRGWCTSDALTIQPTRANRGCPRGKIPNYQSQLEAA